MAVKDKKSGTDRGKLVKLWGEHIPLEDLEKKAPGRNQKGSGIYVLYNGSKVHYIGLSRTSIRSRLRTHATKDEHKGKWDNFSFYQIVNKKYVKDTESILLRIYGPKGNRYTGTFRKKYQVEQNGLKLQRIEVTEKGR